MEKLVIIGNGPAGATAAIYAARANLNPLMFAGNQPGGLLTMTGKVENFPGFPDGIEGFDLVMKMQEQAEKFGARIEYETIERFMLEPGGIHRLEIAGGGVVETQALIVASGASPRYLGLAGEEKFRNHGVSACATCDGAFFENMPVAVVGGGDSAMEEANFLTRFANVVYVIHRRDQLKASPIMAERARKNPKIKFIWNSVVTDLLGDGELEKLALRNVVTGEESFLECRGYFCALGHIPNTKVFDGQLDMDASGYIRRVDGTTRTSCEGVFAAGDCADPRYRQAICAAASGCQAAMDAERYLESRA